MLVRFFMIIFFLIFSFSTLAGNENIIYKEVASDLAKINALIERYSQIQSQSMKQLRITSDKVKLFSGADSGSRIIKESMKGDVFQILDTNQNWYAIALDKER